MYDSVTTWRLYSAEQSIRLGQPLTDVTAARGLVRRVERSAWWRDNVAYDVRVGVRLGGCEADGWVSSFARPGGLGQSTSWTISLHPSMLNDMIVFHELAHCIAPRWQHSGRPRRSGELPNHIRCSAHGPGFAAASAELAGQFGTVEHHDELRVAYHHFQVPVLAWEEYLAAVQGSLLAERDIVEMHREVDELFSSQPSTRSGSVPQWTWGDRLRSVRGSAGTGPRRGMSREHLAQLVSRVERCSPRDVQRLEAAAHPPEDPRLRRLGMCMAVALGFDPIYARFQLGLARWDCDVKLDELAAINPEWVQLVETMNAQLAARPPRWAVDGDR
ncbi:hypothetical protein IN07_16955 [Modestobacter caceresii]|uniref:Uncharacterized protein n=1 Tax=Modestobacter caceresii TaxID=1522368 RepID=A0A098Y4N5_9ACTN|nr:transcriptional regulator [Modestobacter caceresii]KGH45395.1 hypothetical protein IN07_16955 [Modestobacter caceresii]